MEGGEGGEREMDKKKRQSGGGRRTGLKVGEKQVGNYLKSRVTVMCIHVNRVTLIQLYIHHLWS